MAPTVPETWEAEDEDGAEAAGTEPDPQPAPELGETGGVKMALKGTAGGAAATAPELATGTAPELAATTTPELAAATDPLRVSRFRRCRSVLISAAF